MNREFNKRNQLISAGESPFKVVIIEEVTKKIQYLCRRISNLEWSGVILYKTEGEIEDPENFICTVMDLYPLDIGTPSYTEFDYYPEFISYITENDHLLDYKWGLIHSHQNMDVFFSSTDDATLVEQAPIHKNFLSVIVNNKMETKAAMSRVVMEETKKISFTNFKHEKKFLILPVNNEVIYKYEAEVEMIELSPVSDEFISIVNDMRSHVHESVVKTEDQIKTGFRTLPSNQKRIGILGNDINQRKINFNMYSRHNTTDHLPSDEDFKRDLFGSIYDPENIDLENVEVDEPTLADLDTAEFNKIFIEYVKIALGLESFNFNIHPETRNTVTDVSEMVQNYFIYSKVNATDFENHHKIACGILKINTGDDQYTLLSELYTILEEMDDNSKLTFNGEMLHDFIGELMDNLND